MNEGLAVVLGAVLGSIATLIANLIAERIRTKSTNKDNAKNLRLLLKLEFEATLKYLNELKIVYGSTDTYQLRYTGTISRGIAALENYKPNLFMLQNTDLQRKVASLITELSLYINDIDGLERLALDITQGKVKINTPEQDKKWLEKERKNKLVEIVDFRRQLEDIIQGLN